MTSEIHRNALPNSPQQLPLYQLETQTDPHSASWSHQEQGCSMPCSPKTRIVDQIFTLWNINLGTSTKRNNIQKGKNSKKQFFGQHFVDWCIIRKVSKHLGEFPSNIVVAGNGETGSRGMSITVTSSHRVTIGETIAPADTRLINNDINHFSQLLQWDAGILFNKLSEN